MEQDISSNEETEIDTLAEKCDNLINKSVVRQSRNNFMLSAILSYKQASILLGYFSKLKDFDLELERLNIKLTTHRTKILSLYIDILPANEIKSLTVPSKQTKMYQKGIHKYHKVRNYIMYSYRKKLYDELDYDTKCIEKIRMIVDTIVQLDKHYDIYEELIVELQKNNEPFKDIMQKHLSEYIYL